MPTCYWDRCHCPETQPCTDHAGFNCGRWGNVVVQTVGQINDANTRDAELALVALDQDQSWVERMRQELEQKQRELERERQDLVPPVVDENAWWSRTVDAPAVEDGGSSDHE